jgi:hypothetical protein
VRAPESAVALDPELPELELEPPLDPEPPELPLEPEEPLDPELPELRLELEPLLEEPPRAALTPELLLDPERPELPLESELLTDPEVDPLLASNALASGGELELSPLGLHAQKVAVAAATERAGRARIAGSVLSSSNAFADFGWIGCRPQIGTSRVIGTEFPAVELCGTDAVAVVQEFRRDTGARRRGRSNSNRERSATTKRLRR